MATDDGSSGVNALAIVAILAIVVGVGLAVWFFFLRSPGSVPSTESGTDIKVKIDSSALEMPYRNVA